MSSSDPGESHSPAADAAVDDFGGGIAFHLDDDGNLVPVSVGAPGYAPSPELMSLASTLMPFLNSRMQRNAAAAGYAATDDKKDKAGGSGSEMKIEECGDGVGRASSSTTTAIHQSSSGTTAIAQDEVPKDDQPKKMKKKNKKRGGKNK